jgi:hypothetical protein
MTRDGHHDGKGLEDFLTETATAPIDSPRASDCRRESTRFNPFGAAATAIADTEPPRRTAVSSAVG